MPHAEMPYLSSSLRYLGGAISAGGLWDEESRTCYHPVTTFLPRNHQKSGRFQTADIRHHAANHHDIMWLWVWHPKIAVVCACPSIRSAASENIRLFSSCGRGAPCRFLLGGSVLHLSTSKGSLQHAAHAPIVVSVRRTFPARGVRSSPLTA